MHQIPESEMTPDLAALVRRTVSQHEPLKLSAGRGETAVLMSEQDYQQLLRNLQRIKGLAEGSQPDQARVRVYGSAKGLVQMADDFDAPLDDFKDYIAFSPSRSL